MPRKKATDALEHLGMEERDQVLTRLLERHRELRREANQIAENIIRDACVEAVAKEVASRVGSLGIEAFHGRTGKQPWGYVKPGGAAWELLEESISDIRADMKRRFRAGSDRVITLRATGMGLVVPGEVLTILPNKLWHFSGHPYISGKVDSARVDAEAINR